MNKPPEKVETYYNIPLIASISVLLIGIAIVGKIPKKRTITSLITIMSSSNMI